MVFSSVSFLLFFLPSLLILYFITPQRFRTVRNIVLLAFSLIFYGCCGVDFLLLMVASIAVYYVGALGCSVNSKTGRKLSLVLTLTASLGILAVFKYAGFFISTVNSLGIPIPIPEIVLPVGISFFTFQGLSYVIDVYRRDAQPQKNPLNVALYIALFPQLVAGPIVRYSDVDRDITERHETLADVSDGLVRFLCGLAKKMVLANGVGELADTLFSAQDPSAALAWLGAVAYAFQIYFDFSAYSDMAIGLGRIFGFRFPENFDYPYLSRSVTEFWRRWHMSLSGWFRDYVYIPFGGNRCSVPRHIFNLFVVWFLTGLWHGASWNFVLWGLWFFVLLVFEKYVIGKALAKLPGVFGRLWTLIAVLLSWVLFRTETLADAGRYLGCMFGSTGVFYTEETLFYLHQYAWVLILCVIGCLPLKKWLWALVQKGTPRFADAVLTLFPKLWACLMLVISYLMLATGSFNPFIYFQF